MSRAVVTAAFAIAAILFAAMAGVRGTTASFSDSATSTGNTFTAAVLPAPLAVTPTPTGPTTMSVGWTTDPSEFATAYEVYRHQGGCTGWTPIGGERISGSATNPLPDSGLTANTQYCYAVRGLYQNWTSSFTFGSGTTALAPPPSQLFITGLLNVGDLLSTGSLRTTSGVGGLVVVLPGTWPSEQLYSVPSAGTWTLNADTVLGSLLLSGALNADVWLGDASSCGSVPSPTATNYIAGGTKTMPLLALNQHITLNLASNSNFVPGSGRICLRLSSTGLLSLSVLMNGNSYLAYTP